MDALSAESVTSTPSAPARMSSVAVTVTGPAFSATVSFVAEVVSVRAVGGGVRRVTVSV